MPLSNDQIVNSLIAFYKSKGVDLSYMLDDPVFRDLKTPDKVDAIRTHAKTLYEGSSPGMTPSERAGITSATASGTMSGIGAGIAAGAGAWQLIKSNPKSLANSMAHNKSLALVIGTGAILAGAVGAGAGYLRAKNQARARLAVRNQIGLVSKDPSDMNIIGVLSTGATYAKQYPLRDALFNKVVDKLEYDSTNVLGKTLPDMYHAQYAFEDTMNPVRPPNQP